MLFVILFFFLGTGLGLGIVFSVVFFKRKLPSDAVLPDAQTTNGCCTQYILSLIQGRTWPITLGSGMGLGMAYANCQTDLRLHYLVPKKVSKTDTHIHTHTKVTISGTLAHSNEKKCLGKYWNAPSLNDSS